MLGQCCANTVMLALLPCADYGQLNFVWMLQCWASPSYQNQSECTRCPLVLLQVPAYLVCTLPDSQAPSPSSSNDNVVVNV